MSDPSFVGAPVTAFHHAPMSDGWDNIIVGMKVGNYVTYDNMLLDVCACVYYYCNSSITQQKFSLMIYICYCKHFIVFFFHLSICPSIYYSYNFSI